MSASTARHETRALLRAHLAAAVGYRHLTRRCPVCHRLLRLAMEPVTASEPPRAARGPGNSTEARPARENSTGAAGEGGTAAPGRPEPPTARPEGINAGFTDEITGRNTPGGTDGNDRDDGNADGGGDERPPPA